MFAEKIIQDWFKKKLTEITNSVEGFTVKEA